MAIYSRRNKIMDHLIRLTLTKIRQGLIPNRKEEKSMLKHLRKTRVLEGLELLDNQLHEHQVRKSIWKIARKIKMKSKS
jgi:hypothetical protein